MADPEQQRVDRYPFNELGADRIRDGKCACCGSLNCAYVIATCVTRCEDCGMEVTREVIERIIEKFPSPPDMTQPMEELYRALKGLPSVRDTKMNYKKVCV